jgi:hypothetical protein
MADASNGRAVFSSSRNTHYAAGNAIQDEIAALSQPVDALFWINRLIKALLGLVALRGLYEWQRRTRYRLRANEPELWAAKTRSGRYWVCPATDLRHFSTPGGGCLSSDSLIWRAWTTVTPVFASAARFGATAGIEVLAGPERCRRWAVEQRQGIVAAAFGPRSSDATVGAGNFGLGKRSGVRAAGWRWCRGSPPR